MFSRSVRPCARRLSPPKASGRATAADRDWMTWRPCAWARCECVGALYSDAPLPAGLESLVGMGMNRVKVALAVALAPDATGREHLAEGVPGSRRRPRVAGTSKSVEHLPPSRPSVPFHQV
jgi:hypothetical protein